MQAYPEAYSVLVVPRQQLYRVCVCVCGLCGVQVQKLLARHKAELAAVQGAAAEEARRQLDAYVAQSELATRQLRERLAKVRAADHQPGSQLTLQCIMDGRLSMARPARALPIPAPPWHTHAPSRTHTHACTRLVLIFRNIMWYVCISIIACVYGGLCVCVCVWRPLMPASGG